MRSRLVVALVLAFAASAAQADWKKDYERGLKAADAGQWSEAETAMRAALSEDGEPSAKKRFQGVVFKVYVPHYYAGLAAYRQGNCQRALDYWNNAASASVVSSQAELSGVQTRGIADCKTKLAQIEKPVTPPTKPVVVETPTKPVTTPTKPPDKPVVVAPPPKPPVTEPTKPPVVVPSTTPAPAALIGAVEGYLAGRYAEVAQLNPGSLSDGRAKAQAFLLRAASRHTLAELAANEAQLEQARQDVRAARNANAGLSPDEALFSPRFRAFWRATR